MNALDIRQIMGDLVDAHRSKRGLAASEAITVIVHLDEHQMLQADLIKYGAELFQGKQPDVSIAPCTLQLLLASMRDEDVSAALELHDNSGNKIALSSVIETGSMPYQARDERIVPAFPAILLSKLAKSINDDGVSLPYLGEVCTFPIPLAQSFEKVFVNMLCFRLNFLLLRSATDPTTVTFAEIFGIQASDSLDPLPELLMKPVSLRPSQNIKFAETRPSVEVAKYSIEEGTVCLLASGSKAVDAGLRLADLQVWLQIKQSDSSAATSADLEPTEQLARENQDVLFIVAAQQRIHKGRKLSQSNCDEQC